MTGRCAGCHVGPEDECVPGCPATRLERIGWTREQAADILSGRFPRHVEGGVNLELDLSPLLPEPERLIEVLDGG